jgi:Zn-dependent peptidase ImmA (M78 family)
MTGSSPLLLYIAAHELVHVVRFERGEVNFDASEKQKSEEEETVHRITRNLLRPMTDPDLNLVLDCFSNRYRIGDLIQ